MCQSPPTSLQFFQFKQLSNTIIILIWLYWDILIYHIIGWLSYYWDISIYCCNMSVFPSTLEMPGWSRPEVPIDPNNGSWVPPQPVDQSWHGIDMEYGDATKRAMPLRDIEMGIRYLLIASKYSRLWISIIMKELKPIPSRNQTQWQIPELNGHLISENRAIQHLPDSQFWW